MLNEDVFEIFPVLETDRLVLRQITLDDAEALFQIYSDPQVMRYWGSAPLQSIDEARRKIEGINAAWRAKEGIRWGIIRKGSDRLIGSGGHWRLIKKHFRSEIGYELMTDYWGQGIMTEALGAILRFGFETLGLHSVEAQIDPQNLASRKVLEKLGFLQEGYLRENYCFDGTFTDTALFSLLRPRRTDAIL
jgi:ribosomal-protein-alanine N-acetyltransferase